MGISARIGTGFACTLAAACGMGERLTTSEVVVRRPVPAVVAPLFQASTADAERLLPGLKVVRSRPSDRELQYLFPGDGKQEPARLLFRFEPVDGGRSTRIATTVSVPMITMTMNGQRKMLSGRLVSAGLSRVLSGMVAGRSGADTAQQFSAILAALAISTDASLRDKALTMSARPELALRDMLEREADRVETAALADGNDPTEYDTPRDQAEEFAPQDGSEADGGYGEATAE